MCGVFFEGAGDLGGGGWERDLVVSVVGVFLPLEDGTLVPKHVAVGT